MFDRALKPEVIRLGTRPSQLALRQAEEIKRLLPSVSFETVLIKTAGDKDKVTPFSVFEGSDFFTREIEAALLKGNIDAAVHSAKDLEDIMPPQLTIAAITGSISAFECLVSGGNKKLDELPKGAVIGTSSRKRKEALRRYRADFIVRDIRGTIQERLEQLDERKFDAIIVAQAALIRLGQKERIAEIISPAIIEPHPLQGALAIQVRADRADLMRIFSKLQGVNYENKS